MWKVEDFAPEYCESGIAYMIIHEIETIKGMVEDLADSDIKLWHRNHPKTEHYFVADYIKNETWRIYYSKMYPILAEISVSTARLDKYKSPQLWADMFNGKCDWWHDFDGLEFNPIDRIAKEARLEIIQLIAKCEQFIAMAERENEIKDSDESEEKKAPN